MSFVSSVLVNDQPPLCGCAARHEVTGDTEAAARRAARLPSSALDERPAERNDAPMPSETSGLPGEVTGLLVALQRGDSAAADRLFTLVYDELRRIAAGRLRGTDSTLSATALVHEAYLKLSGGAGMQAVSRSHLLAVAARAMRQVLIDHHRQRQAGKRGGDWARTTLGDGPAAIDVPVDDAVALADALERLDPRQRQVVEYRLFGGLEESEIASLLGVSERTVRRDWIKGRAWLVHALLLEGHG
jgi:RNA polymerase sigma factor (TIGR02999 family)